MADIVEQAVGEILVIDKTGPGVAAASRNFQRLYEVVRYNWWGIQNLGRAFETAGGAIAAGIGEAVKSSIAFEQGMAQVSRTSGVTGQSLDEMAQALRNLALRKPISLDDLTQIAAAAGQLGIEGKANILSFTSVIADLVSTTNLTADSAEQLAKLAGPLGIAGDEWSRLGSTILTLGINSAATESQIVSVATQLAGLGQSAHATTPEIIAVSTVIASLTTQTSSGATGIQRLIQQMASAASGGTPKLTAQFEEFAKVAGYTTPAAVSRFRDSFNRDAIPSMADFIVGLGKMHNGVIAQTAVLNTLGITEQREIRIIRAMAAGTQQNANATLNIKNAVTQATDAWNKNVALTDQANKLYQTTQNQLKILNNIIHDVAISFGGPLLGALNKVLGPIADIASGFDAINGPFKTILTVAAVLSAGLLLLGGSLALMIPRIVLVIGSLKELSTVFAGATNEAKLVVTALRSQAATAEEAAGITVASAARMSAAEKEKAVAAYQAANAMEAEAIKSAGAAEADAKRQAAAMLLAEAQSEKVRETLLSAEADERSRLAAVSATQADIDREEAARMLAAAESKEAEARTLRAAGDKKGAAAALEDAAAARTQAGALQILAANNEAAVAAVTELAAASDAQAVAAGEVSAEMQAQSAALLEEAAATERATIVNLAHAEALAELEVAETDAAGSSYLLGEALDAATGPFGIVFGLITAVTIGLGLMGAAHRKATDAAQQQVAVDQQLFQLMTQGHTATDNATKLYYLQNQAFLAAAHGAEQYGFTIKQLYQAVTALDLAQLNNILDTLKAKYEAGDKAAGNEYNAVLQLYNQHRATAISANTQAESEKQLGVNTQKAADASSNLTQSLTAEATAHEKINSAILDYPDALLAVGQANEQLKKAEQELRDARARGNTKAEDVQAAEDKLKEARISARQAAEGVKAAEQSLADARRDQIFALKDAQDKLASDTASLADAKDRVLNARLKLQEDQETKGTTDLTKAVNALNDAYASLYDATQGVYDAQYNLNYLISEGASARDIADAQEALTESQNKRADATQSVVDAQNKLKEAQRNAGPKQLAKDERDLAAAERDVHSIQRQLKLDTEDLNNARNVLKNNTLVKDREDSLHDAEIRLREANLSVRDATIALADARRETGAEDETQAELNLESALLGVAKAHVQVRKDLAEMHGQLFGTGHQAKALAEELGRLGDKSGPVGGQIQQMIKVLLQAKRDINTTAAGSPTVPTTGGGKHTTQVEGPPTNYQPIGASSAGSWITGFEDAFRKHARDIAGAVLGVLVTVFGIVALGVSAPVAIVVGAIVAGLVLIVNHRAQILHAFEAIGSWIKDAFISIIHWIGHNWVSVLVGLLTGPFGFAITWLGQHFHVIDILKNVWNWIKNQWSNITDDITAPFGNAWNWIVKEFDRLTGWITSLPSRIVSKGGGMFQWIFDLFKWPIAEIQNLWNEFWDWLGSKQLSFHIPWPINKIPGVPDNVSMGFGFLKDLEFHIPGLAEGGIVTRPTLAMVGEGRSHEAIMPLDRLHEMFHPVSDLSLQMQATQQAMQALLSQMESSGGASGDTFNISGADADPIDIAREIVFQKKIRLG